MRSLAVAVAVAVAIAACAHAQAPATAVSSDDAIIYIKSNISDADLVLDGRLIGRVSMLRGGIAIDPGHHQLELRHDDYFSAYLDVQLARAERKKIALDLAPILP